MTLSFSRFKAFSLVEITISLGIMAFCMLAIFGLLPVGLNSNTTSIQQTKAAGVASGIAADLRAQSTKTPGTSLRYGFIFPPSSSGGSPAMGSPQTIYTQEDGTPTGAIGIKPSHDPLTQSAFRVTVGLAPPATTRGATMARIMVTWPAFADEARDASGKKWPTNQLGTFETVVGLNRN